MPRFFIDQAPSDHVCITGEDAIHISRSLRMKTGDHLTLCDGNSMDLDCIIQNITAHEVTVFITARSKCPHEPTVKIHLYQGVTKGDKLETIIQKAVELGVYSITPVLTERSVSRPDPAQSEKKRIRLQKIALEAAKQSGRGIVPQVHSMTTLASVIPVLNESPLSFLFYEGGGSSIRDLLKEPVSEVCIFIGPEGGFSLKEVGMLQASGARTATLGPRILRTETAPLAALSAILFATGNMD